jgi:hypothetical protein
MIANIASDDALILPHRANLAGSNFRERQVLLRVLSTPIQFRDRGRVKKGTLSEALIRKHVALALKGDIGSAGLLLRLRAHVKEHGDYGHGNSRLPPNRLVSVHIVARPIMVIGQPTCAAPGCERHLSKYCRVSRVALSINNMMRGLIPSYLAEGWRVVADRNVREREQHACK